MAKIIHWPWKWIAAGLAVLGLVVASRFLPFGQWSATVTEWVQGAGAFGVAVFIAGYIVGTLVFFPGSLMTLAAGVAFGLVWGIPIASFSAMLGAACAFLIARYLARSAIDKYTSQNEKFAAIDSAIGEQGWKIVALLRLSPVVPFNFINYFFGLTKINFWPYVLASWIGMVPGTVLYVYLGYAGKTALAREGEQSLVETVFLAIGLIVTIAVTIYVTNLAKKKLKRTHVKNKWV